MKKPHAPARIDRRRFRTEKKFKSVPGFEPGLLGNNAIALPLAPPLWKKILPRFFDDALIRPRVPRNSVSPDLVGTEVDNVDEVLH